MSANNKNVPKIRFPGFTGDWEQRRVNELGKVFIGLVTSMTKNYRNVGTLLIRNSDIKENRFEFADNPIHLEEGFAEENRTRRLFAGDVVTVHTGDIGTSAVITENEDGAIGFATINTRPNPKILDSNYLSTFFNTNQHKKFAMKMSTGDGRSNYNLRDFNNVIVPLPSLVEQKKIGEFIKSIDNLITLHQRKLNNLENKKKSLLQKMFPKKGSNVPEIRFPGFTGAWEQRQVKCLIDEGIIEKPIDGNHGEKHPTASEYVDDGIPFLMATDIKNGMVNFKKCNFITIERSKKLDKGFAKNGDVLVTHKATIGEVAILCGLSCEYAVLTPQITYYRVIDKSKLSIKYLYSYFNSPDFQSTLKLKATQSTRPYIGITSQHKLDIKFPQAIKEQEKIGTFFSELDSLITLHQRRLDHLQEQKKSLLQQMFI